MTAPHIASDNTAIEAAHQRRMENARNALDAAVAAFHLRPAPRWHLEALIRAAGALRDEAIAGLERAYGREEGSFGRTPSYECEKSPAEAPPAADEASAYSDIPVDLARALYEAARGLCAGTDWNNGTQAKRHGYRAKLMAAVEAIKSRSNPAAITHTDGSPMHSLGGSMHERTEARLAAAEAPRRDIEHTSPTGRLEHAQADFARPMVPRYPEGKA